MLTEKTTKKNAVSFPSADKARGEFPELRIVPREDLMLHEETDAGRQVRLVDRISNDGFLRNPPVVARLRGSQKYLLLDGANRVSALDCLEVQHFLVQVEKYEDPALILSHWNHVVRDPEARSILDLVKSVPGVFIVEGQSLDNPEEIESHYLCTIVLDEKRVYRLFGGRNVAERVRYLRRICSLYYHGAARIDRVNHSDLKTLRKHHANYGAVIVYRDFSKDEIRQIAEAGNRLPSGLTRFLLPRRVLGFNVPLALLSSGIPLEEKQRQLDGTIRRKVKDKKVRYYEEPAFVFDD